MDSVLNLSEALNAGGIVLTGTQLLAPCRCHCHNNHEGFNGKNAKAYCRCIPSCEHCNPYYFGIGELTFRDLVEKVPDDHEQRMGRPIAITKTVLRNLRRAFLMGYNDSEACAYAEIGERTLYDFQAKYPEFSQWKEEWKTDPILKAKETIYKNLFDPKIAAWYLERKKADEFTPPKELTGPQGKPIPVAVKIEYVVPKPPTDSGSNPDQVRSDLEATSGVAIVDGSSNE